MYECVILFRNPYNKVVGFVHNGDPDNIAVFPNIDEALKVADIVPMLQVAPFQIVELDEI